MTYEQVIKQIKQTMAEAEMIEAKAPPFGDLEATIAWGNTWKLLAKSLDNTLTTLTALINETVNIPPMVVYHNLSDEELAEFKNSPFKGTIQ